MAKYKAPKNFGGITHGGETYTAAKKGGAVTLPDHFPLDVAAAHGLTPADEVVEDAAGETDPAAGGEGAGA